MTVYLLKHRRKPTHTPSFLYILTIISIAIKLQLSDLKKNANLHTAYKNYINFLVCDSFQFFFERKHCMYLSTSGIILKYGKIKPFPRFSLLVIVGARKHVLKHVFVYETANIP